MFDPTRYGMPPKSIESVDPMQLMALDIARQTLADAGYEQRGFNREKASVIIGASGCAGDVGMQYGLRSELPRFSGDLPGEIAERLPQWTEDTFAGILINVMAGRIANRLDFGGVNFATDAACASSLAAIYQGINELLSGRSDLVIAGGVDTVQGPFGYLCFSKTQALSPRGRCRTFDESADGIVISEGIAMLARVSPVAWSHINLFGRYEFGKPLEPIDLDCLIEELARMPVPPASGGEILE